MANSPSPVSDTKKEKVHAGPAQVKREIFSLHIVRILFSLLVVVNHYWQKVGNPKGGFFGIPELYYVSLGGVAVSLFIILSGFVLSETPGQSILTFYKRRLHKIYSVYWASIVLTFLTMGFFIVILGQHDKHLENVATIPDIAIFFSGFMAFFGKWANSMNSPAWFIGLIACLYLLYPLLARFIKKTGIWGVLVLLAISVASRYYFTKFHILPMRPMDWFPPSRVFEFGLGIYLHPLMSAMKNSNVMSRLGIQEMLRRYSVVQQVSQILRWSVLYLSAISFPLFLVHYPLLNSIDFFRTTNVYIFSLYVLSSVALASACYYLSRLNIWVLAGSSAVVLTLSLFVR